MSSRYYLLIYEYGPNTGWVLYCTVNVLVHNRIQGKYNVTVWCFIQTFFSFSFPAHSFLNIGIWVFPSLHFKNSMYNVFMCVYSNLKIFWNMQCLRNMTKQLLELCKYEFILSTSHTVYTTHCTNEIDTKKPLLSEPI